MAKTYWISFRLHDSDGYERTYNKRLADLTDAMQRAAGSQNKWWFETTSFFVIESDETIDDLVARVKRAIDVSVDLVIIGMTDFKTARAVGDLQDQDILSLIPFMKKV